MSTEETESNSQKIILADTNVAYALFFFLESGIVPKSSIFLNGFPIEFHPIVKDEAEAHSEAHLLCKEYEIESDSFPGFFETIGKVKINEMIDFINNNLTSSIPVVDVQTKKFSNKRKAYEKERVKIQQNWKKTGVKGNKVKSKPSNNDYSILFSAECFGHKILTNDEILLSVSQEFLAEEDTFKSEDVINQSFKADPSLKSKIQDIANTLKYLQISFNISRALR